jgi:hypothetical protein
VNNQTLIYNQTIVNSQTITQTQVVSTTQTTTVTNFTTNTVTQTQPVTITASPSNTSPFILGGNSCVTIGRVYDFEDNSCPWDILETWGNAQYSIASPGYNSNREGQVSISQNIGGSIAGTRLYTRITLTQGALYKLSFAFRVDSYVNQYGCRITLGTESGVLLAFGNNAGVSITNGTWYTRDANFIAQASNEILHLGALCYGYNGTVHFDNVLITRLSQSAYTIDGRTNGVNLVQNSNFESGLLTPWANQNSYYWTINVLAGDGFNGAAYRLQGVLNYWNYLITSTGTFGQSLPTMVNGTAYVFSVHYRWSGGYPCKLALGGGYSSAYVGNTYEWQLSDNPPPGTWKKFSFVYTPNFLLGPSFEYIFVRISCPHQQPATVNFGNVSAYALQALP